MFPKLPKSQHELHECLNAFEVKHIKEIYFSWQMTLKIYVQTELDGKWKMNEGTSTGNWPQYLRSINPALN